MRKKYHPCLYSPVVPNDSVTDSEDLIRLRGCTGWSKTSLSAYVFHGADQLVSRIWDVRRTSVLSITKTRLYNFDPLKPHFYIVKLGFTGVYIIFLIAAQNIDCGYSLEPPRHFCRGDSNEYPQSMFWAEIWKISEFFIKKLSVFVGQIFYIFE